MVGGFRKRVTIAIALYGTMFDFYRNGIYATSSEGNEPPIFNMAIYVSSRNGWMLFTALLVHYNPNFSPDLIC